MKGIVFTEFMNLVEEKFGLETLDKVLYSPDIKLESEGVYTAVGTYPHGEMVALLGELSKHSKIPSDELLQIFGKYLFTVFERNYGVLFKTLTGTLDFLEEVESYIHVEVQKLYPDAELPTFEKERISDVELNMIYSSNRKMSGFAHGLILGCAEYFKEELDITKEDLSNGEGSKVKFNIRRVG